MSPDARRTDRNKRKVPWNIAIAFSAPKHDRRSGADVFLLGRAAGTGPFTYQWRFNGNDLAGGTGSTYSKIVVRRMTPELFGRRLE